MAEIRSIIFVSLTTFLVGQLHFLTYNILEVDLREELPSPNFLAP